LDILCSPSGHGYLSLYHAGRIRARRALRGSLIVVAGLLLAFMMPAAAPAQPDEPAVLEGAVSHRLVLDEAFVKSIPADVTFETDKGKSSGRYTGVLL
jgi:hypothetical protein